MYLFISMVIQTLTWPIADGDSQRIGLFTRKSAWKIGRGRVGRLDMKKKSKNGNLIVKKLGLDLVKNRRGKPTRKLQFLLT